MDVDNEYEPEVIYARTTDDVRSMIRYAKLDERKLTTITQALYYPNDENYADDVKLLELDPHLLAAIKEGQTLAFKGGLNEKLVLCSDTKTFDVKEADISNSLLLVPNMKHSQATSTSPLKSPKGNVKNRSMDKSLEEDPYMSQDEEISTRELEQRPVIKICHEYFECREINPRFRKLYDLLQLTRYSGPENEYCIDRSVLFTFDQLLETIQCSRAEFHLGLRQFRAIEIDGRYRVLDVEYEYRTISLMLGLITENSWKLDEIEREETLSALATIVPEPVLRGLFDLYTNKVEDTNAAATTSSKKQRVRYQYKEEMVCRMIAQNILQQGLKFHVADFITTWQEALPEGMQINESYLRGIGIIDRESSVPCVRSLIETNLSVSLLERMKILFSVKEKWTLGQIEPYIEYFTTPQLSVTSILAKNARSITVDGQRIYVSKHG